MHDIAAYRTLAVAHKSIAACSLLQIDFGTLSLSTPSAFFARGCVVSAHLPEPLQMAKIGLVRASPTPRLDDPLPTDPLKV